MQEIPLGRRTRRTPGACGQRRPGSGRGRPGRACRRRPCRAAAPRAPRGTRRTSRGSRSRPRNTSRPSTRRGSGTGSARRVACTCAGATHLEAIPMVPDGPHRSRGPRGPAHRTKYPRCGRDASPRNIHAAAAAAPRLLPRGSSADTKRFDPADDPRCGRGVAAVLGLSARRRRDTSSDYSRGTRGVAATRPRTIHVVTTASPPSSDYPRGAHGVAATFKTASSRGP